MEELQKAEQKCNEKDQENRQMRYSIRREENDKRERAKNELFEGYSVSSNSNFEWVSPTGRVQIVCQNKEDLINEKESNYQSQELIVVINKMMKFVQDRSEDLKSQKNYLIEIDNKLEEVEKQQKVIVDDLQLQMSYIAYNQADFENYK